MLGNYQVAYHLVALRWEHVQGVITGICCGGKKFVELVLIGTLL
jgi:hypothetical protein